MTSTDSRDISTARSNRTLVMVANFSEEELVIPKATLLGIAEEMKEKLIDRSNAKIEPKSGQLNDRQRKKRNELLWRKLLRSELDHLPNEEQNLIELVLLDYADVFSR